MNRIAITNRHIIYILWGLLFLGHVGRLYLREIDERMSIVGVKYQAETERLNNENRILENRLAEVSSLEYVRHYAEVNGYQSARPDQIMYIHETH